MLKRPRYLPIATAVLKTYGVIPAILYGYCITVGTEISSQFKKNSTKIAEFMGIPRNSYISAKRIMVEAGLIDLDFLPLKPPVEPFGTGVFYVPSFVHIPINMLYKQGFHRSYILTVICDVTAVKGPINTNVHYWQWLLDLPKIKIRMILSTLHEQEYIKITKEKKLILNNARITIVPTEKAWNEFLWSHDVLYVLTRKVRLPSLSESISKKFSLTKR